MPLAALVPQFWYYGFLGAFFTHEIWFPLGVAALLWWMNAVVANHRDDQFTTASAPHADHNLHALTAALSAVADGEDIASVARRVQLNTAVEFQSSAAMVTTLNFLTPAAIVLGIIAGLTVVRVCTLPPLLDVELWHTHKNTTVKRSGWRVRETHLGVPLFIIGAIILVVGVTFLRGAFEPEVSASASLAIGAIALIFGGVLVLNSLVRLYRSTQARERLDFGYLVIFTLFAAMPFIFTALIEISFHAGGLFQAVLLVVFVFTALLTHRWLTHLSREMPDSLEEDVRYSPEDVAGAVNWWQWLPLYIPLALTYLVTWLVFDLHQPVHKDQIEKNVAELLLTLTIYTVVLELCLLLIYFARYHRRRVDTRKRDESQSLLPTTTAASAATASSMNTAAAPPPSAASTTRVQQVPDSFDAFRIRRT